MAKRAASFDRTVWDTGVSPVARGRSETCSVCAKGTGPRYFWVEERVMCERCADRSIPGGPAAQGTSVSRTMLFGVVAMVVIAIVYAVMHLSRS